MIALLAPVIDHVLEAMRNYLHQRELIRNQIHQDETMSGNRHEEEAVSDDCHREVILNRIPTDALNNKLPQEKLTKDCHL